LAHQRPPQPPRGISRGCCFKRRCNTAEAEAHTLARPRHPLPEALHLAPGPRALDLGPSNALPGVEKGGWLRRRPGKEVALPCGPKTFLKAPAEILGRCGSMRIHLLLCVLLLCLPPPAAPFTSQVPPFPHSKASAPRILPSSHFPQAYPPLRPPFHPSRSVLRIATSGAETHSWPQSGPVPSSPTSPGADAARPASSLGEPPSATPPLTCRRAALAAPLLLLPSIARAEGPPDSLSFYNKWR